MGLGAWMGQTYLGVVKLGPGPIHIAPTLKSPSLSLTLATLSLAPGRFLTGPRLRGAGKTGVEEDEGRVRSSVCVGVWGWTDPDGSSVLPTPHLYTPCLSYTPQHLALEPPWS